jgi:hypothetical protein
MDHHWSCREQLFHRIAGSFKPGNRSKRRIAIGFFGGLSGNFMRECLNPVIIIAQKAGRRIAIPVWSGPVWSGARVHGGVHIE